MKKLIILFLGLVIGIVSVYALNQNFKFDSSIIFNQDSKRNSVKDNFNQNYNLTYSLKNENWELEEEIKNLTKKTTYLLFGGFNNENETSEEYYKRHQDWFDLRYAPTIPSDPNNSLGLDTSSQEYKDDIVSGLAIPQIFNQAAELGLIYNSYGDIRVAVKNDIVISSITLPNVKIKSQSEDNPMNYEYIETNYIMYYFYKKLNDEWKLYYLYGESTDEINDYFNELENQEVKGLMAIAPSYDSKLTSIYNFEQLKSLSNDDLNRVFNENINKIVFLDSYYNNMVVASANGFFISNNLLVTTWNFLEKSLINGQYISIKNHDLQSIEIEGIVTVNPETNLAVIKVKNSADYVLIDDYDVSVEQPVITISSKTSSKTIVQTGIVIANDTYLETSIPLLEEDEGSPLFNKEGKVIGLNVSNSTRSSVSFAVKSEALKEIQDKFKNQTDFDTVSFETLKEQYYYLNYHDEKILNNIPLKIWQEYSSIGDIENNLKLPLIKSSYQDKIVSLRYKNGISQFISSMQLASNFKEQLKNDGFDEVVNSEKKSIFQNKKYQIIIRDELDYLIIVMVKL